MADTHRRAISALYGYLCMLTHGKNYKPTRRQDPYAAERLQNKRLLNISSRADRSKSSRRELKRWWIMKMKAYYSSGRISPDGFLRVPNGTVPEWTTRAIHKIFPHLTSAEASALVQVMYPERRLLLWQKIEGLKTKRSSSGCATSAQSTPSRSTAAAPSEPEQPNASSATASTSAGAIYPAQNPEPNSPQNPQPPAQMNKSGEGPFIQGPAMQHLVQSPTKLMMMRPRIPTICSRSQLRMVLQPQRA